MQELIREKCNKDNLSTLFYCFLLVHIFRFMKLPDGCIMDAPAATAYAVLPVGVETISPSPCTTVTCLPSINKSTLDKYGLGPRSTTTSLRTRKFKDELLETSFTNLGWIVGWTPFGKICPLVLVAGWWPFSVAAESLDCLRFKVHFNLLRSVRAAFPVK